MSRAASDQEQITLRLPRSELAKVEGLRERLRPMVSTRADLLRMVFQLGMEAAQRTADAYQASLPKKVKRKP